MIDENLLRYNALDAAVTIEIADAIMPDIEKHGFQWTYDFTMRILPPLRFMMYRGIRVDKDRLEAERGNARKLAEQKQEELTAIAGRPLNPLSSKDCQTYFYVEKGVKPYTKPDGRGGSIVTTDDRAMQRLAKGTSARQPMREAALVQEIRGLRKLVGTYLEIEFDKDGRFRCAVNPRGTVTGRISTSKTIYGTGMNMQNLPPRFKSFLVPDDGRIFIEMDKAGAEWVVVAYLSGDANMLKVVQEKRDPHAYTASLMLGLPEELIKAENKKIGHITDAVEIAEIRRQFPQLSEVDFVPRSMSCRQFGKKSNHGLNYDERAGMFALINELPDFEAKRAVMLYHQVYPNIRKVWYARVQAQLKRDRTITNFFGRKRRFYDKLGDDLYKAAYAQEPQSTVSDNLNLGMCAIYEDNDPILHPIELLANVHDSLLSQYPDDDVEKLADAILLMKQHLDIEITLGGRSFVIGTDVKVGYDWGESGMIELKNVDNRVELIAQLKRIISGKQRQASS